MRRIFVFTILLALVFGMTWAQEKSSGTLEGTVAKEDGSPIDGAIVTAIGPQGIKTTTTGSAGKYVIRGLISGIYKVKAEAPGFSTVVQSEVEVSIGTRTQLPFTLTAGVTEEVTVVSQAPVVDLKSTTTGETIRIDDFAPYVPLGRNLTNVINIAPGVSDGGDPVLGNTNASISGSSGLENAYFVDGVNVTNSGYGALGAYSIVYGSLGNGVTYDFLEEVQVKTGGFEAEFGQAGGGVVNSVVRSGTNSFNLDVAWYEEPTSLEGNRSDRVDIPNIANAEETLRRDISVAAGGPILQDRLFYFAAYNPITLEDDFKLTSGDSTVLYDLDGDGNATDSFGVGQSIVGGRVPATVTRERSIDNYAGKVSWFLTPNHKLEVTAFGDPSDGKVGPQSPTTFLRNLADPVSIPDPTTGATGLDWGGDQLSLKYQGVWTSNFFTELLFANKTNDFSETGPGTSVYSVFNSVTNNTIGGAGFYEDLSDEVDQITFKNTHVFGPVELSYGYQNEDITWAQPKRYSGPAYMATFPNLVEDVNGVAGFTSACANPANTSDPACYTSFASSTGASLTFDGSTYDVTRTEFTPDSDATQATEDNIFAQVSWDVIPSVTIKAGVRWTEQELTGSGNFSLPIGTLPTSGQAVGGLNTTLTGQTYKFDSEIAPRFGVTWDVINNGKHKLYANYGEYYQRVPSDLAVRAFSNEVGVTSEYFNDMALTAPNLNGTCGWDTNNDGIFDSSMPCHEPDSVQGLAGGGSIILDGTQQDPNSDVYAALGGLNTLASNAATKLPYTKETLFGYAWEVNDFTSFEVRYIMRELGRVLEDVQFASNEQTWNLFWGESGGPGAYGDPFPGHGIGAFGAYVFANVGSNVDTNLFPLPTRDYNALEFVLNRRFNNGWMAYANYRWSTLEGNYEGSFRNDNGQSDPFLTSLFDFPMASAVDSDPLVDANGDGFTDNDFDTYISSGTLIGQFVSGPLNTERQHIFNAFLAKQFDMGLNIGGRLNIASGQPRGPLFAHPTYRNSGEVPGFNPQYWWGVNLDVDNDGAGDGVAFFIDSDATRSAPTGQMLTTMDNAGNVVSGTIVGGFVTGPRLYSYDVVKRDFFGRTPTQITFDVSASYDINLRGGKSKLTLLLDVFNLFNDTDAVRFDNAVETRPGVPNPDFLKATGFQGPRNVRLGAKFSW